MLDTTSRIYSCFDGFCHIASGTLAEMMLVCRRAMAEPKPGPVLLFDDTTGRTIDIDPREAGPPVPGRSAESVLADPAEAPTPINVPRGRGRPKLGVVAREVTLLPRHWDWLASQSGGASVVLRKLIDQARRNDTDDARQRQERAYHFMSVLAGNLPGFEEAIRALFANDLAGLQQHMAGWPDDVRGHALQLAMVDAGQRDGVALAHHAIDTSGHREMTP